MRVLAALATFVAVSSAGAATSSSGLRGMVTRGPIVPVCVAEQPCDGPAKNLTLAFVRDGHVVRRATTNDQGRYGVTLAPGLYSVRLMMGQQVGRGLEPSRARVAVNRMRRVDFSIDTGIR
jgi:hypothetical protein